MKYLTPVAFIVFNRPETTMKVFQAIRQARPTKLFLIADGPREKTDDDIKCAQVRTLLDQVDWDCEVLKNYSEHNMGCRERVSSGLNWLFDNVSEAVILEDDCLPSQSFFKFCEELLARYRHDQRIAQIGGINFQFGKQRFEDSYYFSKLSHIWGWASWRRAWKLYDVNMTLWSEVRETNRLADLFSTSRKISYWQNIFQNVADNKINTWDYQWLFTCWINNMLTILPNKNLISNIGYGSGATHTTDANRFINMATSEMAFPLRHPDMMIVDSIADDFTFQLENPTTLRKWLLGFLKTRLK